MPSTTRVVKLRGIFSAMAQAFSSFYYDEDEHTPSKPGEWCVFSFAGTGVKWIGGTDLTGKESGGESLGQRLDQGTDRRASIEDGRLCA